MIRPEERITDDAELRILHACYQTVLENAVRVGRERPHMVAAEVTTDMESVPTFTEFRMMACEILGY